MSTVKRVMAALNVPCVQPFGFKMGETQAAVGPKWDKWLLRFENYMTVIAIEEDVQKKALLQCYCMLWGEIRLISS